MIIKKKGRGRIQKLTPFRYRHFTPWGWSRPRTLHFFSLNHLYMDPIWKINRFVFESSKCVFVVHLLIFCWLSADNLDYPDNCWLSVINSGVFSWWGLSNSQTIYIYWVTHYPTASKWNLRDLRQPCFFYFPLLWGQRGVGGLGGGLSQPKKRVGSEQIMDQTTSPVKHCYFFVVADD